jgi:isopropylmalate/homocitrate/citramalate synthase
MQCAILRNRCIWKVINLRIQQIMTQNHEVSVQSIREISALLRHEMEIMVHHTHACTGAIVVTRTTGVDG